MNDKLSIPEKKLITPLILLEGLKMPFLRKTGRRSPPRPAFDKWGGVGVLLFCLFFFFFLFFFFYFPFSLQGEMPPELQTTHNKAK